MDKRLLRFGVIPSIVGCSISFAGYLLTSSFWSAVYFEADYFYALFLSFYLLGFGVGALTAFQFFRASHHALFILLFSISTITAWAVPALRFGIGHSGATYFVPAILCALLGFSGGGLIALGISLKTFPQGKLSRLLFFVYQGSTIGGLGSLLILIPAAGYQRAGLCLSVFGILAGIGLAMRFARPRAILLGFVVLGVSVSSIRSHPAPLNGPSRRILASRASEIQRITLTEERVHKKGLSFPEHILYLDGYPQFASSEDARYHFCFAQLPIAMNDFGKVPTKRALVLGGGNGLIPRNLLGYSSLKEITVVEPDAQLVDLATHELGMRIYNLDAFRNRRVKVLHEDPLVYVSEHKELFDIIYVDMPLPRDLAANRYYTAEFYGRLRKRLEPSGSMAIHGGFVDTAIAGVISSTLSAIQFPNFPMLTGTEGTVFVVATNNPDFKIIDFQQNWKGGRSFRPQAKCRYAADFTQTSTLVNTLAEVRLPLLVRQSVPIQHAAFLPR